MSSDPWVWCAALLTIMIFSYLWKENPFYRFAEHLFVGVSVGYLICITWYNVLEPKLVAPMLHEGRISLIIPAILTLLMLFRFSSKYGWLSFFPLAFLVGLNGYSIPSYLDANLLQQVQATVNVSFSGGFPVVAGGIIIMLGTLICLFYFYFSVPHTGALTWVARGASVLLMISFGASFGYTVMARISLLIGRVMFLFKDWLGVIS